MKKKECDNPYCFCERFCDEPCCDQLDQIGDNKKACEEEEEENEVG